MNYRYTEEKILKLPQCIETKSPIQMMKATELLNSPENQMLIRTPPSDNTWKTYLKREAHTHTNTDIYQALDRSSWNTQP